MAIDLETTYPAQTNPANANYPFGEPRNVSAPGAGDGTPWEQALCRDIFGFLANLLDDAAIVPTNTADTAVASQYRDALDALFVLESQLAENGGNVLQTTDRLLPGQRTGLLSTHVSGTNNLTTAGTIRNQGDTADLTLPADITKDISATWVAGDTNGGLVAGAVLAQGMWRKVLINTPGGVADIIFTQSPTATDVFLDANVIAAGYSDATLYKRVGYVYVDAGLNILEVFNTEDEPNRFVYDQMIEDVASQIPGTVSRTLYTVNHVPENLIGIFQHYINTGANASRVLVTETRMSDIAAGANDWTLRTNAGQEGDVAHADFKVDGSQQIGVRESGGATFAGYTLGTRGWIDNLLVA